MNNEQQQPRCEHCGSRAYRITSTRTHDVYRCLSSSKHLTYVEKTPGQRVSIQWNGNPPDAA